MKNIILIFFISLLSVTCGLSTMPSKDPWYAQHFFIMQDFEREAYRSFSPAGKLAFQQLFWQVRPTEAKEEFDNRMAYIEQNYKRENFEQPWNTDRARVFLLNGPPAHMEQHINDSWTTMVRQGGGGVISADERTGEDIGAATLEVWAYNFKNQIVYYGFIFQAPNKWKQVSLSVGGYRYMGELELENKVKTYGAIDEEGYKRKIDELKALK